MVLQAYVSAYDLKTMMLAFLEKSCILKEIFIKMKNKV